MRQHKYRTLSPLRKDILESAVQLFVFKKHLALHFFLFPFILTLEEKNNNLGPNAFQTLGFGTEQNKPLHSHPLHLMDEKINTHSVL